jgi:uncharacterized short protein YbdD (DUF466 family)
MNDTFGGTISTFIAQNEGKMPKVSSGQFFRERKKQIYNAEKLP